MKSGIITKAELSEFSKWAEAQKAPKNIQNILAKLIKLNDFVADITSSNRNLLKRLRELMGFSPKSERGSQLNQSRGD